MQMFTVRNNKYYYNDGLNSPQFQKRSCTYLVHVLADHLVPPNTGPLERVTAFEGYPRGCTRRRHAVLGQRERRCEFVIGEEYVRQGSDERKKRVEHNNSERSLFRAYQ